MARDIHALAIELLDCFGAGIVLWTLEDLDDDGSLRLDYFNAMAGRVLQLERDTLGQRVRDVFPRLLPERLRTYACVCRDRARRELDVVTYADERRTPATYAVKALPVGTRSVAITLEHVDALRQIESEARAMQRSLDSILEQVPAMIFIKDAKHLRFERFNRAGEELLGISRAELLGKSDYDFFPRQQADFFVSKDREVLASKSLCDIPEEPIETPRGTRWLHTRKIPLLDAFGEPRSLLGISLDITEQKEAEALLRDAHDELARRVKERTQELEAQVTETLRAQEALARTEEQLRHSQKMEAIGRLAGGVAHDFNNMLSVVLGYSDLVLSQLPVEHRAHGMIEEIRKAGTRAAQLTAQLLAFSRQQVLRPRVFALDDVVRGMEGMLTRLVGEDIELRILPAVEGGHVKADPNQIEQVIMNLVVNARDAMPAGGKLTVETARVELDERYAAEHLGVHPGSYLVLAVSDTGVGMDKATQARMFEPFYTTKEKGKGTGLGLSTVLGIVQQSGGTIWVYSEPEAGSTFKVYLPRVDAAPTEPRASAPTATAPRGTETVLVVEDDEQVRALAADVLRRHGFVVLEARNGTDAERVVSSTEAPIDLLLTDVVMPQMGGRSLAQRLAVRRPSLRVLFMSGYTDDAVVRHGILEAGIAFVQKPLTPSTLLEAVRAALDGPEPRLPSERPSSAPNAPKV